MKVIHRTILEEIGRPSTFPQEIRNAIVESLEGIDASEYRNASKRREHEEGNLDSLIFSRLSSLLSSMAQVLRRQLVSKATLFKNDIEISTEDCYISLEIEKGTRGRFELDIEKMRAFAYLHKDKHCFGVFIIPCGNSLPRDVTGRRGESSFNYVLRVGRLVAESEMANLDDILVVGYYVDGENSEELFNLVNVSRLSRRDPVVDYTYCESKRYEGKNFLYWWDLWDTRRNELAQVGKIHFIKKDTGERAIVTSRELLPLLTEARRTSRMRGTTGGNWGIKVLPGYPDKIAIEEPGVIPNHWAKIPVKWVT